MQANRSGVAASTISTINLPWTGQENNNRYNNGAFSSIILIGMAFMTVAPTFAIYMVKDREVILIYFVIHFKGSILQAFN
jgi:hypothetical protein